MLFVEQLMWLMLLMLQSHISCFSAGHDTQRVLHSHILRRCYYCRYGRLCDKELNSSCIHNNPVQGLLSQHQWIGCRQNTVANSCFCFSPPILYQESWCITIGVHLPAVFTCLLCWCRVTNCFLVRCCRINPSC